MTAPVESPALTLRRAAERVRDLAAAATSPEWPDKSWRVEQCARSNGQQIEGGCACIVYQGEYKPADEAQVPLIQYVADGETEAHAAHIAAWSPARAGLVAEILVGLADRLCHDSPEMQREVVNDPDMLLEFAVYRLALDVLGEKPGGPS